MKIVVAVDSFKGCLSSAEANRAAARGAVCACSDADVVQLAVSDGGEGFLEAFRAAAGGQTVEAVVSDPLMRPVAARYLLCGDTAVLETAQASGLMLLSASERNPLMASSYGTGQLVADAIGRGARHIIVGLGGSATSDAGVGMLRALRDAMGIDDVWSDLKQLAGVRFTLASDVQNPLCGEHGAAAVFAPQKGATAEMVAQLDERARQFAESSALLLGRDCSQDTGAGAAGGLGYAFMQYFGAACRSGADVLLDAAGFSETARDASMIITGEGSADRQTLMGKLPVGILRRAAGVPVFLIAGRLSHRDELLQAGFADAVCINPPGLDLSEAMRKEVAQRNIAETVERITTSYLHNYANLP